MEALGKEVRDATVNPNPTPRIEAAIKGLASMITGQPKDEVRTKALDALHTRW